VSGIVKRVRRMLEELDEEKIFDIVLVVATIVIIQFVAKQLLEAMNAGMAELGEVCVSGEGCEIIASPPLFPFEIEVLSWVVAVATMVIFIVLMEIADRKR
jgi:hypothetical protein